MRVLILALLLTLFSDVADAAQRSPTARNAFTKAHPCPATGKTSGKCPGYVVDHIVPLCAGGPDAPSNMQWQTVQDTKVKDELEKAQWRRREGLAAEKLRILV